jgi:hypothetical protein
LILDPIYPPSTIENVHTIAIILDSLIISILVKSRTSQETMIALMDFIVENTKTGNATPGSSQTVRKVTAGGWGWMWGWDWGWGWGWE